MLTIEPAKQPPSCPDHALVVDALTVMAAGTRVLDDVSLSIRPGEILGLVGSSGCGKSTLARCLLRLEAPLQITSGQILFRGLDLVNLSPSRLRQLRGREIALVQQDPLSAFDPVFTVDSQLHEFTHTHADALMEPALERCAHTALDTRLARLGLSRSNGHHRSYPHQWSRGMLQRTLFALAGWPAPALLILDEPTAALDAPRVDRLLGELTELVERQAVTVLLITHDLAVAAQVCQHIAVLHAGRLIEMASTANLLNQPHHEYTRELVASALW